VGVVVESGPLANGQNRDRISATATEDPVRLHTRIIERTVLVRFAGADNLSDEGTVQNVCDQLDRLVESEAPARLLLNLAFP
jgi:hypothetical protein